MDLVLVRKVLVSTSLIGLVTPSGPVGALTNQRYWVKESLMFSAEQMEAVLSKSECFGLQACEKYPLRLE